MKLPSAAAAGRKRLQKRRKKRKDRIRKDLERYGGRILHSREMQKAYHQTHHTRSTVAEHTRRVAENSLAICYALDKLHIRTDIPAIVTGSLCHDLGILDRDEKYDSNRECYHQHPTDSLEVARKLVDDLPEKTADIIERHMWPHAGAKAPNSLEAAVITVADKAAAVEDFIWGSRVKRVGFKETIQNIHNIRKGNKHRSKTASGRRKV